jgi:hypothetical protein
MASFILESKAIIFCDEVTGDQDFHQLIRDYYMSDFESGYIQFAMYDIIICIIISFMTSEVVAFPLSCVQEEGRATISDIIYSQVQQAITPHWHMVKTSSFHCQVAKKSPKN